jgi:hypothetical protein
VLRQLLTNLPALPRVAVLTTLKFEPLPYVTDGERFMAKTSRIPGVYRVVVRWVWGGAQASGVEAGSTPRNLYPKTLSGVGARARERDRGGVRPRRAWPSGGGASYST